MTDRPRLITASQIPPFRSGWRLCSFAVCGRACQALDLFILCGAALCIIILPRLSATESTLGGLLDVRITLGRAVLSGTCIAAWWMVLSGVGVYSTWRTRSFADYFFRCIIGLNACTLLLAMLGWMIHRPENLWRLIEVFWAICLMAMFSERVLLLLFFRHVWPRLKPRRNLVIIGSGARAKEIHQESKVHPDWDYHVLGFIDSEPQRDFVPPSMILGGLDDLEQILMHSIVDEVVIALPIKSQYEAVGYAISLCQSLGIQSQYFTNYFGIPECKADASAATQSGRVIFAVANGDFRCHVKRALDLIASFALLLVLSPVMLAVAMAVKLSSPGPILFRQQRFGLNKRLFPMLKFRSMAIDAEDLQAAVEHLNETSGPVFKIKNDPRLTPIGSFLRKFSLDELPQLFNVLAGQMSLVGPRPLPLRDVNRFSEAWLMRRFSVKPGITCLWQVMGRSNTEFERWIELDLQYIDNWSLSLDVQILFRTIPAVITSHGAS